MLVEHKADVNVTTLDGWTPLLKAVKKRYSVLVKYLVSQGADVNKAIPDTLNTALHIACLNGDLNTIQILADHGANLFAMNKEN